MTPGERGHWCSLRGGITSEVKSDEKRKDVSSPDTETSSCKSSLT